MLPIYPRMRPPGLLGALPTFALGFLVGLLTLHLYTFSSSSAVVTGPRLHTTTTTTSPRPPPPHPEGGSRHIPPVVHFIQLKPAPDAELHFPFEAYLAFYAAYRAVRPTAIHLHTDFPPADVERARERGSSWTRRLLTLFPHVLHIHHVVAPTHAGPSSPSQPSLPILRIEHKSDLLRLDVLSTYYPTTTATTSKSTAPHHPNDDAKDAEDAEGTGGGDGGSGSVSVGGGIYLDWDVLTLRSPRPLLRSSFPFIAGRQPDGYLNNGILLARADSAALALLRRETPLAFDGGWITHSVGLLTRLVTAVNGAAAAAAATTTTTTTTTEGEAEAEAEGEGEILVLDHKACAPFSWEQADVDVLLARHEDDPASIGDSSSSSSSSSSTTTTTITDDLPTQEDEDDEDEQQRPQHPLASAHHHRRPRRPWERDLGDAYFLHKFFNDVDDPPGYRGVSVPYILARDSNYAVAAWPIVRDGIREGFIDEFDATL